MAGIASTFAQAGACHDPMSTSTAGVSWSATAPRLRTFLWFVTAVAGFTVRTELLGVTSLVRAEARGTLLQQARRSRLLTRDNGSPRVLLFPPSGRRPTSNLPKEDGRTRRFLQTETVVVVPGRAPFASAGAAKRRQCLTEALDRSSNSPADTSPTASRVTTHGAGPMRIAAPSPWWPCTSYSLPVFTDAPEFEFAALALMALDADRPAAAA
jgi:hypothetical protein